MKCSLRRELCPEALGSPRLGVLGGSFDPPHRGHLHALRAARQAAGLAHIVCVPAARSPHKAAAPLASDEQRVEMLELLLQPESGVSQWTFELERPGPSYSIDTVRELCVRRGSGAGLFWILGADHLEALPHWREIGALLELVQPLVIARSLSERERGLSVRSRIEAGPWSAQQRARLLAGTLEVEELPLSSSALREQLSRGERAGAALGQQLADYIAAHALYRDPPSRGAGD